MERNFTALRMAYSKKDGIAFYRCEFGSVANNTVVIRQSGPTPPGSGAYPDTRHNIFHHCILERPLYNTTNNSHLTVTNGPLNTFSNCVFACSTATTATT